MNRFGYLQATTLDEAVAALAAEPAASVIAGGTNLVDLMKADVARPSTVIDIGRLSLGEIVRRADGGLRLGALATNAAVAHDPRVEADCPLLSSAILAGASGQLRNRATTGGNLLQRTRCAYFYDIHTPCNKRAAGSGCGAVGGVNRYHAILGASPACIATHPSDMCVALAALGATVNVIGPVGERTIPFEDFHRLPGGEPERDTTLARGEIVTSIDLPAHRWSASSYLKVRDRLSYAFALVSAAVALDLDGGRITRARIAAGGVAHKPWRVAAAEDALVGQIAGESAFAMAADILLAGATGQGGNDFKLSLARDTVMRALAQAAAGAPQTQSSKRVA
jgi:xanthine dehydrogenase YagS FAD-binding subunit